MGDMISRLGEDFWMGRRVDDEGNRAWVMDWGFIPVVRVFCRIEEP
jgi:hypothetical protein